MPDRRAFVIVLDACGAGELPDSAAYGDAGANTLGHVAEAAGEVADQRLGTGAVVDAEDVGVQLVGGAGDQHDRDACRHPPQVL
mgnify:CR=1 FL=1